MAVFLNKCLVFGRSHGLGAVRGEYFAAVFCLGLVHALVVHFGQGVQLLAQVFVVFAAFLVLELAYGFQTQEHRVEGIY